MGGVCRRHCVRSRCTVSPPPFFSVRLFFPLFPLSLNMLYERESTGFVSVGSLLELLLERRRDLGANALQAYGAPRSIVLLVESQRPLPATWRINTTLCQWEWREKSWRFSVTPYVLIAEKISLMGEVANTGNGRRLICVAGLGPVLTYVSAAPQKCC